MIRTRRRFRTGMGFPQHLLHLVFVQKRRTLQVLQFFAPSRLSLLHFLPRLLPRLCSLFLEKLARLVPLAQTFSQFWVHRGDQGRRSAIFEDVELLFKGEHCLPWSLLGEGLVGSSWGLCGRSAFASGRRSSSGSGRRRGLSCCARSCGFTFFWLCGILQAFRRRIFGFYLELGRLDVLQKFLRFGVFRRALTV